HHGMTGYVKSEILKGALDAGYYVAGPEEKLSKELYAERLIRFTHLIIAPKGWRARIANKHWAELAQLPWIWSHPNSVHNRLLSARFAKHGVMPNIVAQADVEASMLDMVHSDIGLSLARQSVALRQAEEHGLI